MNRNNEYRRLNSIAHIYYIINVIKKNNGIIEWPLIMIGKEKNSAS